jgi:hypothetical protein
VFSSSTKRLNASSYLPKKENNSNHQEEEVEEEKWHNISYNISKQFKCAP